MGQPTSAHVSTPQGANLCTSNKGSWRKDHFWHCALKWQPRATPIGTTTREAAFPSAFASAFAKNVSLLPSSSYHPHAGG